MLRLVVALNLTMVSVLAAQDSVIVINPDAPVTQRVSDRVLPPEVLAEAVRLYNDSTTLQFTNSLHLPAGSVMLGAVALFRGDLEVSGTIEGRVTVINGQVIIKPGGQILGDLLVVGGTVTVQTGGLHRGSLRSYTEIAEVYRDGEGLLQIREPRRPLAELAAEKSFQVGQIKTTLKVSLGGTYNRVEGLPIYFAPIFQWRPNERDTVSLEIRGIFRTAPDKSDLRKDLGYFIDLGWRSARGPRWAVNLMARSEIVGIEDQPLSRSENGWSAFLLQRDYRDWYQAEGIGGRLAFSLARPLRVRLAVRWEDERSVQSSDPWSLLRNSDRWRTNPLIDDGRYLTSTLGIGIDTRNSKTFPSSGWLVTADWEYGQSDNVAPILLPPSIRTPIPTASTYSFNRVSFDIRRYVRVSPDVRVSTRLLTEGWVAGDPLPIQRRYSLGGTDLMPGYSFRSVTCAAPGMDDPAQTALCNRLVVAQVEVRTRLSFGWAYRLQDKERAELDRIIAIDQADLVFFSDAGTAWIAGDGPGQVPTNRFPAGSQWKFDIGAGLDLGGVGVYLAKALTGSEPLRLILRLQRRF